MPINVLNIINIDHENPITVERNGLHVEEVESSIHSISSKLPISYLRIVMIPNKVIQKT